MAARMVSVRARNIVPPNRYAVVRFADVIGDIFLRWTNEFSCDAMRGATVLQIMLKREIGKMDYHRRTRQSRQSRPENP